MLAKDALGSALLWILTPSCIVTEGAAGRRFQISIPTKV